MAVQTARTRQRAVAVRRLIDASNAVAAQLGVSPADVPTYHRDSAYLPTLQIEAVSDLLERIVSGGGDAACTDCNCPDGECAADITITVNDDGTFEADPPELVESVEIVDESGSVVGEAKPKRTRKAA